MSTHHKATTELLSFFPPPYICSLVGPSSVPPLQLLLLSPLAVCASEDRLLSQAFKSQQQAVLLEHKQTTHETPTPQEDETHRRERAIPLATCPPARPPVSLLPPPSLAGWLVGWLAGVMHPSLPLSPFLLHSAAPESRCPFPTSTQLPTSHPSLIRPWARPRAAAAAAGCCLSTSDTSAPSP